MRIFLEQKCQLRYGLTLPIVNEHQVWHINVYHLPVLPGWITFSLAVYSGLYSFPLVHIFYLHI